MPNHNPILSDLDQARVLDLGSSRLLHRISSEQTRGEFAVVEFHSEPGEGVGLHVHQNEDELVYLLEGQIKVTLGDQSLTISKGAAALLPRGIPHGYVNSGPTRSRLLAVLLPGRLDQFFVALDAELKADRPHEEPIARLCERFGLTFLEPARS
ncbi:MAG: cupin domain-containing protein [Phycisphaerales bacterium]|nr:cupin domain-containing protein [Phycisphaerales bacterium]MCB9840075.1 cupin domain-containing protein [Phycisphaeraceae bacterium]